MPPEAEQAQAPLSKTTFVLDFLGGEGDDMTFARKVDPGEVPHFERVRRIDVPRFLYDELGQPNQITVTIQPGDLLNEPEEEA